MFPGVTDNPVFHRRLRDEMPGSQPQGQRSGEGTSGLWNHIRDDDQRKDKEPDRRSNDDSRQQYDRQGEQQQSQGQR
jgi:hypothetical protein